MPFLKKHKYPAFVLGLILVFWFVSFLVGDSFDFFKTGEAVADYVRSFGAWGPLVIIFIIIAEVVLAPIPGYFVTIASGLIYGPLFGGLYAVIGNVLGSVLAFWIARRFGKEAAKRFVSKTKLEEYEMQMASHAHILWLFYFLPVFPVDILSFAFGLSSVSYKKFIPVMSVGFVCNVAILNAWSGVFVRLLSAF